MKPFQILFVLTALYAHTAIAQPLIDINMTITNVSHNHDCGTDAFLFNTQPDPRWRVRARAYGNAVTNFNWNNTAVIKYDESSCGSYSRNDVMQQFIRACVDMLHIEIDSWEEDGGSDDFYDSGGANPDDVHSVDNIYIPIREMTINQDSVFSFNQGNNYTIDFKIKWNIAPAPIISSASKDTVCIGDKALLIATHTTGNNGNFNWYGDANLSQHIYSGGVFNTPNITSTTNFWVTESVVGGCVSAPFQTTVYTIPLPSAPSVNSPTVCIGQTAVLNANSSAAKPLYTWFADNIGKIGVALGASYTTPAINTNPTKYYVQVMDSATQCSSGLTMATISINPKPNTPIISSNAPLCEGDTLKLTTTAIGVGYAWTGPMGFSSSIANPVIVKVNEMDHQGFYSLQTIHSTNGCKSDIASILVDVNKMRDAVFAGSNGTVCEGDTIKLSANSIPNATYKWTGPNGFTSTLRSPQMIATAINSGKYEVVAKVGNCLSNTAETVVMTSPKPTIHAGMDDSSTTDIPYIVRATGNGNVNWSPPQFFDNPTSMVSRVNLPLGFNQLICTSSNMGCSVKDTVNIVILQGKNIHAVNLITPNGDGINDQFEIPNLGNYAPYTLSIYDRGGAEVYSSTNYNNDWSGVWNGKDLPEGAYWWILKTNKEYLKGSISIKR